MPATGCLNQETLAKLRASRINNMYILLGRNVGFS